METPTLVKISPGSLSHNWFEYQQNLHIYCTILCFKNHTRCCLNKGDNHCKNARLNFVAGSKRDFFFVWSQRESDNVVFLSAEVLDFCRTKWQQFKRCPKKETSDSCLIDPFCVTIWSSSLIKRLKKLNTRSPYWHKTLFIIYFSAGNQLTPSKVVWSICQLNREKNKLILRENKTL